MMPKSDRGSPGPNRRGVAVMMLAWWAWTATGADTPDWTQQLRVGAALAFNIKADFRMSGQSGISGSQPGAPGVSGVDHFYDDGYVRVDQTGNAQGYTSYWGYQSAGQYDSATRRLSMHSATSFASSGQATGDDGPYAGLEVAYAVSPWRWKATRIGIEFGFGLLPITIENNQVAPATFNRTTFSFDTGGIVMPTAPYQGGSSGVGPTIRDVAAEGVSDTMAGTVNSFSELEAVLYSIRLGPSFYWDLGKRVGLSAGAGLAVGVVSGDLHHSDSAVFPGGGTAHNEWEFSSTEWTFGGYVTAAVMYRLVPGGDVYLAAHYVPMGSATFSSGGRETELKLGGQFQVSAGLNWPF